MKSYPFNEMIDGMMSNPEKLNTAKSSGMSFLWYALETGSCPVP
jgi:hypothetical protein